MEPHEPFLWPPFSFLLTSIILKLDTYRKPVFGMGRFYLFKRFIKSFFEKGNVIQLELEDWYKWYKEPVKLHHAVVEYLTEEGKEVETLSIVNHVTSNKVSELLIDGVKYELTISMESRMAPAQTVKLWKMD